MNIIFKYKTEKELQKYLIKNFNKYFDFNLLSVETVIKNIGRIDLLGKDKNCYYIIEIKREYIDKNALIQIQKYLNYYDPTLKKQNIDKKGILVAPKIKLNKIKNPKITTKKLKNVKCISYKRQPINSNFKCL